MSKDWEKSRETGKKIGKKTRKKCLDDPDACGYEISNKECKKNNIIENECKSSINEKECVREKIGRCNREVFKNNDICNKDPKFCAEKIAAKECYKKYPNNNLARNNCTCNALKNIYPPNKQETAKDSMPCRITKAYIDKKYEESYDEYKKKKEVKSK